MKNYSTCTDCGRHGAGNNESVLGVLLVTGVRRMQSAFCTSLRSFCREMTSTSVRMFICTEDIMTQLLNIVFMTKNVTNETKI